MKTKKKIKRQTFQVWFAIRANESKCFWWFAPFTAIFGKN